MSGRRSYGDAVPHSLGLGGSPKLVTTSLRGNQIGIARLSCGPQQIGMTPRIPAEDTFILAIYLTRLDRHELWSRGRPKLVQGYASNAMRIVNLMGDYSANILQPHETLAFYMPRAALDELAEEAGTRRIATLRCQPGIIDPVVTHLAATLRPAFRQPRQGSRLFVDHVTLALCAHLIRSYGGNARAVALPKGGLATHQLRRATELMASRCADELSLADLAGECGLSRGHFARAFKASTGLTPYQWLLRYRVDKAKALLQDTAASIAEIAVQCGFADQSHLTRIFGRLAGDSPAAWRRRFRS